MLAELSVENLLLIASARLPLIPGLNVVTGETGAGKTLLAQALGLLMGERADADLVRNGADRALVQALFEDGEGSVAVGRDIPRAGRSRAYLNAMLSSAAVVEQTVRERVAFYGQLEHARLLHLDHQSEVLDSAAPEVLPPLAVAFEAGFAEARRLERRLAELQAAAREREREIDLLGFQVREIEAAAVEPGEDERIAAERARLRNADKLLERVGGTLQQLAGETDASMLDQLRAAARLLDDAAACDAVLQEPAGRLRALIAEAEDVAYGLQGYVESLEVDPEHRDGIERRHDQLADLKRKYGGDLREVLSFAAEAGGRLDELRRESDDMTSLDAELEQARSRAVEAAAALSSARREAAGPFADRVRDELRELAMPHARFQVEVRARGDGYAALARQGADEVEFLFSANPGMPLRPLRETASGGELSRAMLAIKSVVSGSGEVATLIFDEVDTGIGGVTAVGLGERLARLAAVTQIVCITHLPQVAAFAGRHFAITKLSDPAAGTTETVVRQVEGEERLAELCRMLGASPQDAGARRHAEELLMRAGAVR